MPLPTKTSLKRKAGKKCPKKPSKRTIFLNTYRQQQSFSLPDTIMHYITKSPSSSKTYLKMVQSCKYFFVKQPLLIAQSLTYEWDYKYNKYGQMLNDKLIDLAKITSKIWITDKIDIIRSEDPDFFVSVIPKMYRSDATYINLHGHRMTYKMFTFLASKCVSVSLDEFNLINDEDGTILGFEKIIEATPLVKELRTVFCGGGKPPNNGISSQTVPNLLKIPHFSNIKRFYAANLPDNFDIESFFGYIKRNKNTNFSFYQLGHVSKAYRSRLQKIVDEIVTTKNHRYKVPNFYFDGITKSSLGKISNLYKFEYGPLF